MPKLLLFAPCEKVILSEDEHHASLIAILQGFALPPLPTDLAGKKPMLPIPWCVFTLWENDHSGNTYRQRWELLSPANVKMLENEMDFTFGSSKLFHRLKTQVIGFPLTEIGTCTLRLLLKTNGDDFAEVATYPIPMVSASEQTASSPA
jgi:hypothetical protein